MNYKSIGELGQNCVIGELSKYGIGIAPLLSDNYPFDLILIADNKLFKAQVKTSTQSNEKYVTFKLSTNNWHKGTTKFYTKKDCDIMICYDLIKHKCFLLDNFEGKKSFTVRYKKSKTNNQFDHHWYEDCELSEKIIKDIFNYEVPDFSLYFAYSQEGQPQYDCVCQQCNNFFKSSYKKAKYCSSKCRGIVNRKVSRVTKEELISLIKEKPMVKIGKQFGVSDNAVRKWAINYGINIRELKHNF